MRSPLVSATLIALHLQIWFTRPNVQFHHSCATLLGPSKCPEQIWGPPKLPIHCLQRALLLGVKWLRHDTNHLPYTIES